MYLTAYALLLATVLYVGQGQTTEDIQNILTTILSGYNSDVRPANNQSRPVEVKVVLELVNIREFDELLEQISVVILLYIEWVDSRLTWNPLEFNDTTHINIPVTKIWRPNLLLTTPVGKIRPVGDDQDWAVARCLYDGRIMWNPADTLTSSCYVDIRLFPIDEQFCYLNFVPWGYKSNEIMLTNVEDKVGQTFYIENSGWILAGSLVVSGVNLEAQISVYGVLFQLNRRSDFFLMNTVLPIFFISCLNVLVFFIPVEGGERVSYAITVFLALDVFMTIVGEHMPKNSKHLAIISYFLLANVGHSTVICLKQLFAKLFTIEKGQFRNS